MNTGEFWAAVSAIATLLYTTFTVFNLIFVSSQIRDSRRFTQAQFIHDLQREFSQFSPLLALLRQPEELEHLVSPTAPIRLMASECLDFFARIQTLVDAKVIDLRFVDRVFGVQFLLLVNTPQIQDEVLFPAKEHFWEIFAMHQKLVSYRRSRGYKIPFAETDLARRHPLAYSESLKFYRQMMHP